MNARLKRTELLLGAPAMELLKNAHVMVVGCGAVGGYAIEALARAGVGRLTIVDFDVISESNINRQLLALGSTIGQKKVEAALNRIKDISPDIRVEAVDQLLNEASVNTIFKERPDFVVDAIDSLNPKVALITYLVQNNIPFISSMGAALRTDPAQIKIAPMKKTQNCPLAFFIRKRLRGRGVAMDFPVVYSSELKHLECLEVSDPPSHEATEGLREAAQKSGRVRNQLGSLPTLTGIFGLMCANHAIMSLTRK